MTDTYNNIYEYLTSVVGDDRCLGDGTQGVEDIFHAVAYLLKAEKDLPDKKIFGYPAPTMLYVVSDNYQNAKKMYDSFADFVLEHVPATYRHRVDLSDHGWIPSRLTAIYNEVVIKFVSTTQMALATSMLDRTHTYYMVAQEKMEKPKVEVDAPEEGKPMKMSRPVYLERRLSWTDALKTGLSVIGLAAVLFLIALKVHEAVININMYGW